MGEQADPHKSRVTGLHPLLVPGNGCWVCGADDWKLKCQQALDLSGMHQDSPIQAYHGIRYWLRRCRNCGFIQPEALPAASEYFDWLYEVRWSEQQLEDDFASTYKDYIFSIVLRELALRVPAGRRRLLDVGVHTGKMIWLASRAGWQAEGSELNPRTAAFAARKTGLVVHHENAHRLADRGIRFDAVTLTDVLEHIPEPVKALTGLRRVLAPDGWIAVKVPCGRNQYLKERLKTLWRGGLTNIGAAMVHVNHFSPGSLRLALTRAGFTDVRITVGAPELFDGIRGFRGVWSRFIPRAVYQTARWMPFGVHTPLAMNLQAYARSPA